MNISEFTSEIKKPRDLLNWMIKNLKYKGDVKGHLLSPNELLEKKECHCWEATEFERVVLSRLGLHTDAVFIADKDVKHTHTAIIYSTDPSKEWYWFEWAWGKHEGIHKAKNLKEAQELLYSAFKNEYNDIVCFTHSKSQSLYSKSDDEKSVIDKISNWPSVRLQLTTGNESSILRNW